MGNLAQLANLIRFSLSQLGARNAHHEFEHLCRHLARLRICSNIIPSTGPVSAGGDHGRDFETFRSYLSNTDLASSSFVGLLAAGHLAFACTTQKDRIDDKIRRDVATIVGTGSKVSGIHVFLSEDLPVSKRHEVQQWAFKTHDITLDIHDAASISEMLTAADVFWIATEYLNVPAEMYPKVELQDDPLWYTALKSVWSNKASPELTYANFFDIKRAIRLTTFDEHFNSDLPHWLSLMAYFESELAPKDLKLRACYEIAVGRLRGQGQMHGLEPQLRHYFLQAKNFCSPSDLEDAAVLLAYCNGALHQNAVGLNSDETETFRLGLAQRLDELLSQNPAPTTQCLLLDVRGYISILVTPTHSAKGPPLDEMFKHWTELTEVVQNAPLFPLERFSDRLTELIKIVGDDAQLGPLTAKVDELLAQRSGEIIAAEKGRDRAIAFYERGLIARAIDELHRVKISWFKEESLYGCCLSLLLLGEWYRELGLTFAGRYHALAAAFIALRSPEEKLKRFLIRGLVTAADCAYFQGSWYDFLTFLEPYLRSHRIVPSSRLGEGTEEEAERMVLHTATILCLADRLDHTISAAMARRFGRRGMPDWLKSLVVDAKVSWECCDEDQLWARLQELAGRPFNDVGLRRTVEWIQLGTTWKFTWNNDYALTAKVEQLIAMLQIVLSSLTGKDLALLESTVEVVCESDAIAQPKILELPSNERRRWRILLPAGLTLDAHEGPIASMEDGVTLAMAILTDISLLPEKEFFEEFEKIFKDGLPTRVFIAKPYEYLYREFVTSEDFEHDLRSSCEIPLKSRPFDLQEHPQAAGVKGRWKGCSRESVAVEIENRYSRTQSITRCTLGRLIKEEGFQKTISDLRADGWLDWHIMLAIANAVINWRMRNRHGDTLHAWTSRKNQNDLMTTAENPDWPQVPLEEFTTARLQMQLRFSFIATLKSMGLECRHRTPDLVAISKFLGSRYGYWSDDVPHSELFSR